MTNTPATAPRFLKKVLAGERSPEFNTPGGFAIISVRVVNEPLGTVVTTTVVISDGEVTKTEPCEFVIVSDTGVEKVVVGVRVWVTLSF